MAAGARPACGPQTVRPLYATARASLRQLKRKLPNSPPALFLKTGAGLGISKNVILLSRTYFRRSVLTKVTGISLTRETVMDHTQIALTPRDRFIQAAQQEMTKFERQEIEFRKKDREERAAGLRIPLSKDSRDRRLHDTAAVRDTHPSAAEL